MGNGGSLQRERETRNLPGAKTDAREAATFRMREAGQVDAGAEGYKSGVTCCREAKATCHLPGTPSPRTKRGRPASLSVIRDVGEQQCYTQSSRGN